MAAKPGVARRPFIGLLLFSRVPLAPILLALIMLGGLLLRLIFFTASLPYGGMPLIVDEGNYLGLAMPLSQGMGFVDKWVWLRPPGYPLFLASILALTGGSLSAAAFVQILLSVANIGVVYALTVEVFRLRSDVPPAKAQAAGLVAAGLMAANPHVVFYSNLFMVETLYLLGLTTVVWALLRARRAWRTNGVSRQALAFMALAGAVGGASVLVRSLLLSFTPLLLVWFWWVLPRSGDGARRNPFALRWSGRALLPLAAFVVAMFAVILPWTVRNYARYERFLLVETTGGYQLWLYNDNISRDEIHSRLMAIRNPVDREQYASQQAQHAILSNLPAFANDAAHRLVEAWPVDDFSEYKTFFRNKYPAGDSTPRDGYAWLGTIFYIGLGILAIWGFALAPGRTFKGLVMLVLLHYAVTTMITHAEFRYRMPLYPFASIYAGWAIVSLAGLRRQRVRNAVAGIRNTQYAIRIRYSALRIPRSALLLAALLSLVFLLQSLSLALPGFTDAIRYERRYLSGKSRMEAGDYAGALADFEGAAAIDKTCACLYRNIGLVHGMLGEPDEERAAYLTAIAREEHDWKARALLTDRLRAAGDPQANSPYARTRPEFQVVQQRWAWENLAPPAAPEVDVGAVDIGYVMGFESQEHEPAPQGADVTYRWSTEHGYIRLPSPAGEGNLSLRIRWHSLAWPGKPDPDGQVRISVDGREVGTLTAHPGWEEVVVAVPGADKSPLHVIELFTSTQKPPGGEARRLGVAVDSVRLERDK
jgi:tetratricopeptide (TPR) repeat protein